MKKHLLLALLLGLGFLPAAFAQSARVGAVAPSAQSVLPAATASAANAASADIPNLRIAVTQISENRSSSGSSSVNLSLSITGEGLPPTTLVRQVNVTKAVDNQDRALTFASGRGPSMSPFALTSALSRVGLTTGPLTASAQIGGTVRNAESIKYAEGTIELYLPSETNGAIIRIPNIKSHPGRLEDPLLAKYGIVFVFMGDKTSTEEAMALRGQNGGGTSATTDGVAGYGYFYRDPSGMFAGVALQDSRGAPVRTGGGGGGGGSAAVGSLYSYSLLTPLVDDTQLVIYLAVPEALKKVPFRVDDIALP